MKLWTATLAAAGLGLSSNAGSSGEAWTAGQHLTIGSGAHATETLLVQSTRRTDVAPALIIGLHGFGMGASQIASLVRIQPAIDHVYLAPEGFHRLADGTRAWFPIDLVDGKPRVDSQQLEVFFDRLTIFVKNAIQTTGASSDRVFLVGYSQGGASVIALAAARPELGTAFVGLAGNVLDEALIDAPIARERPPTQLFIGHGTRDGFVSNEEMRIAVDQLRGLGISVDYREYPRPHVVSAAERREVAAFLEQMDR